MNWRGLTGWLVQFPQFTVWIQGCRSHRDARTTAQAELVRQYGGLVQAVGSIRVVNGFAGPRRPA